VVVGAGGSGIGLAVVEAFLAEGARVVTADLDVDALSSRSDVVALGMDLLDPDAPARLVAEAVQRHGGVDVLVNVLGIAPGRNSFLDVSDEDWERTLDANLLVMARSCRAALPHMIDRGRGSIVSIASDVARQPNPMLVDYSVSKAAVAALSKALSVEFGPRGIRSNVISPGPTRTPGFVSNFARDVAPAWGMGTEEAIAHFVSEIHRLPLGRLGEPREVAAVAVFLASDVAANVTGSDYRVDGGAVRAV
jgi:NAD(P)-dependent dehydrogenase (short-subunit alcohol dehydrogenase family)